MPASSCRPARAKGGLGLPADRRGSVRGAGSWRTGRTGQWPSQERKMAAERPIQFTDNYEDLSSEKGFQFRFNRERCGNGYMSSFITNRSQAGATGAARRRAGWARRQQRPVGADAWPAASTTPLRDAVEDPAVVRPVTLPATGFAARSLQPHGPDVQAVCPHRRGGGDGDPRGARQTQVVNDLFEENKRMSERQGGGRQCKECGQPRWARSSALPRRDRLGDQPPSLGREDHPGCPVLRRAWRAARG